MFPHAANAINFVDKLFDLVSDLSTWSQRTFGADSDRGPQGALKHLEKEAREAFAAIGTDSFPEEMADCLLLVIDASRRGGVDFRSLLTAAKAKQKINESRNWPTPTNDEPVEHLRLS